jgi:hypothetical protein
VDHPTDHRRPPRNYFSRREQLRLLALVIGLGLVIVMMREASREENWHWLTGKADHSAPEQPRQYDTSYQPTLPVQDPESVRIASTLAHEPAAGQGYFPGVVPEYLSRVKDNRTHRHPAEAAAWLNLWKVLDDNQSRILNAASTGPVTFGQLFEQPDVFRGELVSLRGTARRSEWIPAAKDNRNGLAGYYRLILKLKGGPNRPVFLYVLKLPPDFPQGEKIDAEIEATGFFYKNWLYEANQLSWLAPVVLARDLNWQPPPIAEKKDHSSLMLALGVCGLALFAALVAWWVAVRSGGVNTSPGSNARRSQATAADLGHLDSLPPVAEQLRDLAAGEQPPQR